MRHVTEHKDEDELEITYAIHEVYYDEDGVVANWTTLPTGILSDTADFSGVLKKLEDACKKPTLEYDTGKELVSSES